MIIITRPRVIRSGVEVSPNLRTSIEIVLRYRDLRTGGRDRLNWTVVNPSLLPVRGSVKLQPFRMSKAAEIEEVVTWDGRQMRNEPLPSKVRVESGDLIEAEATAAGNVLIRVSKGGQ